MSALNEKEKGSSDQDGFLSERINALKQSRSGAKASVTKHYNDVKRHYDEKNLNEATKRLSNLDIALEDFKIAHDKYHELLEGSAKTESEEYFTNAVTKAQQMFDLIDEANWHDDDLQPPTTKESDSLPSPGKVNKDSQNDDGILPRDSVSQVGQSDVSTSSSKLRAAAAKSAAIEARLESLQQIQDLECEELALKAKQQQQEQEQKAKQQRQQQMQEQERIQEMLALKQKTDRVKMAAELRVAQAEEEALSEHGSVVSKRSSVCVLSQSEKPKGNSDSVKPRGNSDGVKPKSHNGSDKLQSYKLNPEAPVFNYVAPDNSQAIIQLIQQGQHQQQQLLNSIQLPKAELMAFDGDPLQYWTFITAFKNNVGCTTATESAKLTRLLQYCHGRARKAIECCQVLEPKQGYNKALEILSDRFGNSYVIAERWISKIMDGPNLTANDREGIQSFSDELRNCVECLKAMGHLEEINTQRVMATLVQRLPKHIHSRWLREVQSVRKKNARPNIEHLVSFVASFASEVNDPVFSCLFNDNKKGKEAQTGLYSPKNKGNGKSYTFNIQAGKPEGSKNPVKPCIVCSGKHSLFGCDQFKGLNVEKRRKLAADNRLCFNCLLPGHMSQGCQLNRTCTVNGCGKKHTKFLHLNVSDNDNNEQANENNIINDKATVSGTNTHASSSSNSRVALPIVPVDVKVEGNSKWVRTMALLDSGSTTTFCTEALFKQLGLSGRTETMSLTTLTNDDAKFRTSIVNMEVSQPNDMTKVQLNKVCTVTTLPIRQEHIATRDDIKGYEHLRHIDIHFGEEKNVGLLIGQDNAEILKPRDMRLGDEGSPYAVKTLLGWTLNGPLHNVKGGKQRTGSTYFLQADIELNHQVEKFWSLENCGEETAMSINDKRAVDIWNNSIQKENCHYELAIPLKDRPTILPNNRLVAERRLHLLGKRLQKDTGLCNQYKSGVADLVNKGFAEKVDPVSCKDRAKWYLPHHPVINPRKPEKTRIVFDCASKCNGISLNDTVLQGPDLTNKLVGVLLRFRTGPVAIKADIEAMFHQVRVSPSDRDLLRFLWWKDSDIGQQPEEYRMTVHLFGGIWSPSCANFALRRTTEDNIDDFDSETIETVLKNFYVDDCLKSTLDTSSAIRLASQLCELLSRGGFRLTKWVSNSREVLKSIPESEWAKEVRSLELDHEQLPIDRALGVNWHVDTDTFMFSISLLDKPVTRRGVLSMVSSVYDPLGFLCPYILSAKMLFQDLCRQGLDWDDPLTPQDKVRWNAWTADLPLLHAFKVDRCFIPSDFDEIVSREMHHFSDASEKGLGTTSYLRLVSASGNIHCSFLIAKSRLAPLKSTTIPRLELSAAALAVKVDGLLKRELGFPVEQSVFWSDSTIALGYIKNVTKRFKTFVANRVSAIHEGSDVTQWRHIDGKLNPADDASRGLSAGDLVNSERWLKGPSFLWQPKGTWPNKDSGEDTVAEEDPEVKRQVHAYATDAEVVNTPTETFVSYYSSWYRLKRALAILEKFAVYNYQRYCTGEGRKETRWDDESSFSTALDVADLESAEIGILKYAQASAFSADIAVLSSRGVKHVPKSSSLHRLDPFLRDGIIRVGGRLERAEINEDSKHPLLLPKKSHVTTLIIRNCHEQLRHVGRNHVISTLREKYWIINMNSAVRHVLSHCVTCKRLQAPPMDQKMADLPKERVNAAPPFTHTGVDYFGPHIIKEGRKEYKKYGVLFTCLVSRAIHIETANSLSTDSFIDAFRRFQARRGPVRTIYSDNGTNFVGAERELREAIKEMDPDKVHSTLLNYKIDWKFNPPAASHQGGVWERQIRTVRKVLAPMLLEHGQRLDDESYRTLLCEVEAIVNTRPLTTVSSDPGDLSPLSPSQVLTMKDKFMHPPPGVFPRTDVYLRQKWRRVQYLANLFWSRWTKEYLTTLQQRQKWNAPKRNLKVDDVVLIKDDTLERSKWLLGRVDSLEPDKTGFVRSAKIKTKDLTLRRPVQKLVLLVPRD